MTIGTVGLWHLGEVYSVCLSELGHQVIAVDNNKKVVEGFKTGSPPLPEPGLLPLLNKNLKNKRLTYTNDYRLLKKCNVFWLTIDTPVTQFDRANLKPVFTTIKKIIPFLRQRVLIIISSQLPVGTSAQIINLISKQRPELKFDYAYVPENLRLGQAVDVFFNPSKIIIGAQNPKTFSRVKKIFSSLKAEFICLDLASAEMAKHATNAFLATSLSFINDIADLCELVGADVQQVAQSLRLDPRIGSKAYLGAGLGFSGGTLGRDLNSLLDSAGDHQLKLPVIRAVLSKNRSRPQTIFIKLNQSLKSLAKKKIALFGLTYKSGTSTLRRSMPLEIANKLTDLNAQVNLFDTDVSLSNLPPTQARLFADPYKAVKGCHALIITTPKSAIKTLNFSHLRQQMVKPAILIDAYNCLSDQDKTLKKIGFTYLGVGRN